jgi:hypothetical protein
VMARDAHPPHTVSGRIRWDCSDRWVNFIEMGNVAAMGRRAGRRWGGERVAAVGGTARLVEKRGGRCRVGSRAAEGLMVEDVGGGGGEWMMSSADVDH